jgi:lipid-A-disaccharide synthase-like uncharacterized protein
MTVDTENIVWNSVAGAAQVAFALRFAWQWIVSERRRQSIVPVSFWYFSLAGSLLLATYALARDPVILVSAVPGVVIYARNIALVSKTGSRAMSYFAVVLMLSVAALLFSGELRCSKLLADYQTQFWQTHEDVLWFAFGCIGNAIFLMRFICQWIVSERRRQSVVPIGFWYFSLVGGSMLTLYAIFRDVIVAPSQAAGLIVYIRNLVLIQRAKSACKAVASCRPDDSAAASSDVRRAA